jgi:hypothetical protein
VQLVWCCCWCCCCCYQLLLFSGLALPEHEMCLARCRLANENGSCLGAATRERAARGTLLSGRWLASWATPPGFTCKRTRIILSYAIKDTSKLRYQPASVWQPSLPTSWRATAVREQPRASAILQRCQNIKRPELDPRSERWRPRTLQLLCGGLQTPTPSRRFQALLVTRRCCGVKSCENKFYRLFEPSNWMLLKAKVIIT